MPEPAWTAIAAVLAAALAAITTHRIQRRKADAETTEITDRIAREWLERLEAEVTELRKRLDARDREVAFLHAAIAALNQHVVVLEDHINTRKPPPPPPRPRLA